MDNNGWTPIESLDGLWFVGIYALRHKPSGRVLICGASNTYKRLWDEIRALKHGEHYNPDVRRDVKLDGADAFDFWLVQKVGVPKLLKLLKAYHVAEVAKLGPTYNVKPAIPRATKTTKKSELVETVKMQSFVPPKTRDPWGVEKALTRGLPTIEDNRDGRVDELLKRVSQVVNQYNLAGPA